MAGIYSVTNTGISLAVEHLEDGGIVGLAWMCTVRV